MADQIIPPKKPILAELSKPDELLYDAASTYANSLRTNPDSVLLARGASLAVYDELLRDDQVRSTLQQRRTAVIQSEWVVDPASESSVDVEAADFIKEQLQSVNFDAATDKMHYGVFYGWAVAEIMWRRDGDRIGIDEILVRDRGRFGFNYARQLMLQTREKPFGTVVPDRKFWWYNCGASHDDNPYGLGLAHSVYWPVFFKRNDTKFWLVFLEKFGSPTTIAKLPPGQVDQSTERAKALAALKAIQTDGGIVVPDTMVIELLEAARSGTADYDQLYHRMDSAISKVILSQTMTTDDGSSLAQAKVHGGVADDVKKSDGDLICQSFNQQVVRWLTEWNFPNAAPPRVWRNIEPEEDLTARAERDSKIAALGYEPTDDYIEQTYGPGWKKKEPLQLAPPGAQGALPPEFTEISALARSRVDHRSDQQDLSNAAALLSTKYRELYGERVQQLLNYLETTDDVDTFRKHLISLLAESPQAQAIETTQRANVVARLMGKLRGQR